MINQYYDIPQTVQRGDNVFIYPLDTSMVYFKGHAHNRMAGLSTYWKSPYHKETTKKLNFHFQSTDLHNNTVRKAVKGGEEIRGILKSNSQPSLLNTHRPESSRSSVKYLDKKRKSLTSERTTSKSEQVSKKDRKVKFDDRQSRLNDLVLKYGDKSKAVENSERLVNDQKNNKNTAFERELDETRTNENNNIIGSDKSPTNCKSNSRMITVSKNLPNDKTQFSKHESRTSATENSSHSINGSASSDSILAENISASHESSDVFEFGSYMSSGKNRNMCGEALGYLSVGRVTRSKSYPEIVAPKKVPCIYGDKTTLKKLTGEHRPRVALGRRRISDKTTVNTTGGAIVTRSHVRPIMFSRCVREPVQIATDCVRRSNRNFCDRNKTNQIVQWLQEVREIQSKEGFCISSESDIKRDE